LGIDVGLKAFSTDSEGQTVANPRYLRKVEKKREAPASAGLPQTQPFQESQESDQATGKRVSQSPSAAERLRL
jgi:hypothetical protein